MADAYLKVKDNGAQGLALVREETDTSVSELKTQLEQTRQVINLRSLYLARSQIALNVGIGNTVNPTPQSITGTASLVYPCKVGDTFDINGSGYSTYRLWGLTDGAYKLLSVADAPPPNLRHYIVTATQDGYFISNINTNVEAAVTVTTIKDYATKADVENIFAEDIKPYDNALKVTKNIKNLFRSPYKIQSNVGIGNTVDPTPTSESATGCLCYPCLKGDKFTLTGTGYSSIRLWAFTDTEYKLLSIKSGSGTETNSVHIADQDGYFIVNVNTNKTYNLSVYTFKDLSALNRFDELFPKSRFYKPISWAASDLSQYIHVNNGDFDLFTGSTTAAQYYQLWNDLATASSGYITATELGLASDSATTMYAYDLKPIAGYTGPKLFIVCGQHGFEKAGPFGLYYFVRELVNNYRNNPTLMYLRSWCELVIIPLMNPYGFDNNVYVNANGVNLNRNWPTSEWSAGTSGTTNYGGASAGSEVETQYAVSLFTQHDDSLILTDIHTNGQTAVSNYSNVMWQAFETEINEDEYSKLCVEAAKKEINDLSSAFCIDYSEDVPSYTQIGHYTLDTATGGLATIYAREHNMLAETVEGFPAWPGGTTYKPSCHQANADIFANWLRCVLAVYERLGGNKYTV